MAFGNKDPAQDKEKFSTYSSSYAYGSRILYSRIKVLCLNMVLHRMYGNSD